MNVIPLRKTLLVLLCLAIFAPGRIALADGTTPSKDKKKITPDELVAWVLEENPAILSAMAAAEAAAYRIIPAGSLDDPVLGYSFAPATFGGSGRGLNQKFDLSQSFPWPGTLAARKSAARWEAKSADYDVDALRLEIAALTKAAFAELYYIERAINVNRSTRKLWIDLHTTAATRYAAGKALQQDILQAEVEETVLQNQELALIRQQTVTAARINALLNRPADLPLPLESFISTSDLPLDQTTLQQLALERQPELARLDALVKARKSRVDVARKEFYPNFRLSTGYNSLWDNADKRPFIGLSCQ